MKWLFIGFLFATVKIFKRIFGLGLSLKYQMASEFGKNSLIIDEEPVKDHLFQSPTVNERMMVDDDDEGVDSFSDEIDAPGGQILDCIAGQSGDFEQEDEEEEVSLIDEEQTSGGNLSGDIKRFCGVCEMSFYSMRQLSDHLRDVHAIDKPFQCDVCKARFPYSSSLYNHTRIHSEKKPFRCDQCDAAFRWKNSLKHHKRFIHKVKISECLCLILISTFDFQVVDPAEMEKLNETTFTGALRTMDRAKKSINNSFKQSPRNKKPYSKVVVGVTVPSQVNHAPLKLVVTSSGIVGGGGGPIVKGSKLRSLFPQIQPKIRSAPLETVQSVLQSSMYPNLNTNDSQACDVKIDGQQSELVPIDDDAEQFSKHTCGHCGRKFNLWQTLAKHLVDCEKITAETRSASLQKIAASSSKVTTIVKESFFDNFTKSQQKLMAAEEKTSASTEMLTDSTDGAVEISSATNVNGKSTAVEQETSTDAAVCSTSQCESSLKILRKLEILERKFAELEKNTNEKIAKLEATVADLYDVAAEVGD